MSWARREPWQVGSSGLCPGYRVPPKLCRALSAVDSASCIVSTMKRREANCPGFVNLAPVERLPVEGPHCAQELLKGQAALTESVRDGEQLCDARSVSEAAPCHLAYSTPAFRWIKERSDGSNDSLHCYLGFVRIDPRTVTSSVWQWRTSIRGAATRGLIVLHLLEQRCTTCMASHSSCSD